MMRGIVYKVNNEFTGEAYIGITTNSIKQRQLDHTERSIRGEYGKFYEAIATYGPDAFTWEQIDTADSANELAEKEKQYIIQYNTTEMGYNTDSGGGIQKIVYQYDAETGAFVNHYPNLSQAALAINSTKQDISRACLNVNNKLKRFYWSYSKFKKFIPEQDRRRKRVVQLDLEENFIAEYLSVSEASRKSSFSKSCISRVCRNERKSSNGFIWKYLDKDQEEIINN